MKKSIVIADDNAGLVMGLKEFFADSDKYEVVGTASNGVEAVALVEKLSPDFLLLDIVMPELDGFGVLTSLGLKRPTVIMMSQLATDGFVQKALRYGASYFLAKPFNFDTMRTTLDEFSSPVPVKKQPRSTLDEKIANLFISVGIPAHIKGYQFLREAIKMTVDSPEIISSITKKLYPTIAERFETSPSKVERAIRHAIEHAWNRGNIDYKNEIFGYTVHPEKGRPSNGEFLAAIAHYLNY